MLSCNGPQIFFSSMFLIWGTQQQPITIQIFTRLISRPSMGWNSPKSNLQRYFDILSINAKKRSVFLIIDYPIPSWAHDSFLRSIFKLFLFDFWSVFLTFIWNKNMVIFLLRKKHRLRVKPQVCLSASKFAFPSTWPRSSMNLKRGYVFSLFFFIFAIHTFTYKEWRWRCSFFIIFTASIYTLSLWPKLKMEIMPSSFHKSVFSIPFQK